MAKTAPFDNCLSEYEQWFDNYYFVYLLEVEAIRRFLPTERSGVEIAVGSGLFASALLMVSKQINYEWLLYGNVFLSLSMTIVVLNINNVSALKYLFFLGGIIYSLYSITMNGLLLEVSGHQNRALYAGFAGAGNFSRLFFHLQQTG